MIKILIILIFIPSFIRAACSVMDHQACDEVCKVDSFWYGHCQGWDGKDFSCKCYPYLAPLDGKVCQGKQEHCARKCQKTGSDGGFCYPQRLLDPSRISTACQCFKELPSLRRKKRQTVLRRK